VLALGCYVSRFQRSCRFAAKEIVTVDKAFQQRVLALKLAPVSFADWGKEAEEHEHMEHITQGGARFQRACPGLLCLALSALLPLRGEGNSDRWQGISAKSACVGK
jgi:hypothetical protein